MSFVHTKLNLPLFLMSRNQYRAFNTNYIENYINRLKSHFIKDCKTNTAASYKIRKMTNFRPRVDTNKQCYTAKRCTFGVRHDSTRKGYTIFPGQYNITKRPFSFKEGDIGAYWTKRTMRQKPQNYFGKFRLSRQQQKCNLAQLNINQIRKRCKKHSGIFISNAREHRATSRCMVTHLAGAYQNPNLPGPTTYYPRNTDIATNIPEASLRKYPPVYLFFNNSVVPASRTDIYKKNTAFTPSPATFGTFLKSMLLERQKRLKFRGLVYEKFKSQDFRNLPEFDHIKGKGHTYLFKNIPPKKEYKHQMIIQKLMNERQIQMHPNAQYMNMIKFPQRQVLSKRHLPITNKKFKFKYNCMNIKPPRRLFQKNKKIAFMSGCERFKDGTRPVYLSESQLEAIKNKLPMERQLIDYPVTKIDIDEIENKLYELPPRHETVFKVKRRIKFKFNPVPGFEVVTVREEFDQLIKKESRPTLRIRDFLIGDDTYIKKLIKEMKKNKSKGPPDLSKELRMKVESKPQKKYITNKPRESIRSIFH